VNGYESPQGSSQATLAYNSAMVSDPPTTVEGLLEWVCENPGLFTYPTLPTFTGREFILEIFYRVTGGHEQWQGPWTPELQALLIARLCSGAREPDRALPLARRWGYPADVAPLNDLAANGGRQTFSALPASTRPISSTVCSQATVAMIFEDGTHATTVRGHSFQFSQQGRSLDGSGVILSCETSQKTSRWWAICPPSTSPAARRSPEALPSTTASAGFLEQLGIAPLSRP
jgi:putative spermidine/putrescine transport system substrate-binding protein